MKAHMRERGRRAGLLAILTATGLVASCLLAVSPATAGPDDDEPFKGDGITRNAVDPIERSTQ
jgi:hypothetical protein